MSLLVGADPELFVFKNNVPVSGHGMIKGDKRHPFRVNKGAVQVDGMALEFNIDPSESEDQFLDHIQAVRKQLAELVPGYELRATPVADFGSEYIKTQPKEALVLGCEPDFNAWLDGQVNPRPDGEQGFRTGAGHVHVGWTSDMDIYSEGHMQDCVMFTKELDYYLGAPSLLYDKEDRRRLMYGAAGAFRPKHYGVEYRVLSNAWLNDESLIRWVYRNTTKCFENLANGISLHKKHGDWARRVLSAKKVPGTLANNLRLMGIELPKVA